MSIQENDAKECEIKVLPAGVPFLAAGAVWFILAMVLPVYKLSMVIVISAVAAAVCGALISKRNKELALLPPPPAVKVRTEEISQRLDSGRSMLLERLDLIKSEKLRVTINNIASTIEKISDEVEADPKDRNKARKLANHYVGILTELADKYIMLQDQIPDGINVSASMAKIEEGFTGAESSLKKFLDDLFTDETMEVSADIAVLENLLNMENIESKMDFSSLN